MMDDQEYKYNIGDTVTIREDLEEGYIDDENGHTMFVAAEMPKFAGKVARITYVELDESGQACYQIDADDASWWWTLPMFQKPIQTVDVDPDELYTILNID